MRTGASIKNNLTGETITMLVGEEENNGAFQLWKVSLPPRRIGPPLHYHVDFVETFTVLEGALDFYVGRERRHILLSPAESITVEIGQLHTFANKRDTPTVMTVEARPSAGVVKAFQLAYGVANEGGANKDGLPKNPLVRMLFIRIAGGFVPGVPLLLQKAVLSLAAALAKVTGIEKRLLKYF